MTTLEGDTVTLTKDKEDKLSNIFGVSVRAWIALIFVGGVVGNQLAVTIATIVHSFRTGDLTQLGSLSTIGEPFATLAGIAIGFYFGQKLK